MMKKSISKKEERPLEFTVKTLKAVLVSSMLERKSPEKTDIALPSIKEFVLDELVNGTLAYAGRETGKVRYQTYRMHPGYAFEHHILECFEKEFGMLQKKLDPRIAKDLKELVDGHYEWAPYDCGGWVSMLYFLWEGHPLCDGICGTVMRSTFTLPYDMVQRVRNDILPSCSESERRDIEGIGKAMRPFIRKDLEFIWKTYHW